MNQTLVMANGECKFNMPLKLRKSFQVMEDTETQINTQSPGYASMPEQFKALSLEPGKYFWGYANVEKVDMQGDLFPIDTLEELAPGLTSAPYNKIFLNHDYSDIASGLIVATATDSKGLMILAKLNEDHQRSYEIWQSILNGSLDGLSMGGSFLEVESYYDEPNDMTITVAKKATATEVSLTSIPINGASMMMGAFQKAKKKFTEKYGEPKLFAKGAKVEKIKKDDELGESMDIKKGGPGSGPRKGQGKGESKEMSTEDKEQYAGSKRAIEIIKESGDERVKEVGQEIALKEKYIKEIGNPKTPMEENRKQYLESDKSMLERRKKDLIETFEQATKREKTQMTELEDKYNKSADGENFKYNKSKDNTMVKKEDLNDSQKKAYDKAVADGKSEDEALKMVKKEQVDEADKNVNQDLVGKKKPIKKSVGDEEAEKEEAEEGDAEEDSNEKKADEGDEKKEEAEEEKAEDEDTPEEEDKTDYKKAFEDEKAKNEKLESKLAEFKKSLPSESEKAIRKSKKTEQEPATPVPEKTQAKSGTPFLDYLRN